MDCNVLTEIFTEESLKKHPIVKIPTYDKKTAQGERNPIPSG